MDAIRKNDGREIVLFGWNLRRRRAWEFRIRGHGGLLALRHSLLQFTNSLCDALGFLVQLLFVVFEHLNLLRLRQKSSSGIGCIAATVIHTHTLPPSYRAYDIWPLSKYLNASDAR